MSLGPVLRGTAVRHRGRHNQGRQVSKSQVKCQSLINSRYSVGWLWKYSMSSMSLRAVMCSESIDKCSSTPVKYRCAACNSVAALLVIQKSSASSTVTVGSVTATGCTAPPVTELLIISTASRMILSVRSALRSALASLSWSVSI